MDRDTRRATAAPRHIHRRRSGRFGARSISPWCHPARGCLEDCRAAGPSTSEIALLRRCFAMPAFGAWNARAHARRRRSCRCAAAAILEFRPWEVWEAFVPRSGTLEAIHTAEDMVGSQSRTVQRHDSTTIDACRSSSASAVARLGAPDPRNDDSIVLSCCGARSRSF